MAAEGCALATAEDMRGYKGEGEEEQSVLDRVPDEILLKIFASLDTMALGRCAFISRRFLAVSHIDSTWKALFGRDYPPAFLEEHPWIHTKLKALLVTYGSYREVIARVHTRAWSCGMSKGCVRA